MKAKGFATDMAGSLALSIDDEDWHFPIRRVDGNTHSAFMSFHNKEVGPADAIGFIPNWNTIEWKRIADSPLSKSESYAEDIEFRVNVQAISSSKKSHQEVVGAFKKYMCAD